jgi:MHS family proline/betaine transporter-like MFS transporter
MILAGLCAAFVNGTFAVILTDLFPTRVRFSGVALVFNVAFTLFSGTAPLVATTLIRSTGMTTAPAIVMVACGLLTLAASLALSSNEGHVMARRGQA